MKTIAGETEFDAAALKRCFRIVNGGTPPADDTYWGGDVPWVTPADLGPVDGGSVSGSARTLTATGLAVGSTLVPAGSLILSTRAPIGYVVESKVPISMNQGCRGLVPRVDLCASYFKYVLLAGRTELNALGNGSTFVELSARSLAQVPVPVPAPEEQRRIAAYLDRETSRIDSLMTEYEDLIDLISERRTAEIDRCLQEGVDGEEIRGVASAWLSRVPVGWRVLRLKHCVQSVVVGIVINPSSYYEDSGVPVLRGLNVRAGVVNDDDIRYMSESSSELNQKSRLQRGDVVVVRTGDAGAAAVVPEWALGGNIVDLLLVRPGPQVRPRFLEFMLNATFVQEQVREGSVGALQAHFNTTSLANVVVVLPPVATQDRVVDHLAGVVARYDALISHANRQTELLRERRSALITAAVTGGLDATARAA